MTTEQRETIETIISQVRWTGVAFSKALYCIEGEEITVSFKRGNKDVAITYDRGADLYNVEVTAFGRGGYRVLRFKRFDGVFCDSFITVFPQSMGGDLAI